MMWLLWVQSFIQNYSLEENIQSINKKAFDLKDQMIWGKMIFYDLGQKTKLEKSYLRQDYGSILFIKVKRKNIQLISFLYASTS